MKVIGYELRKIFSLKSVLLLSIITFIFYHLFMRFDFEYFPNGRPNLDIYNIQKEMVNTYGYQMNEREFEHFKQIYEKEKAKADAYLQERKQFAAAGITTYEKFRTANRDNIKVEKLINQIMHTDNVDLFWELQARESLIEIYENRNVLVHSNLTPKQGERVKETIASGNIMSDEVFDNYNSLIRNLTILILVSIMFLISPIFLRDLRNGVVYIQYSSKIGRNLVYRKFLAALIASGIVTTGHLIWFFILYRRNDVGVFLKSNINSVFNYEIFWYDLSFLQYILLSIVVIYSIASVVALVVAILSNIFPNYITIVGIQVPIAILLFVAIRKYIMVNIVSINLPNYFHLAITVLTILISIVIFILFIRREQKIDLLT